MIKGILIFSSGVAVGYAAAMANQEPNGEIKESTANFMKAMKNIVNDAWLDAKSEMAAAKKAVEEEEKITDAEVVEDKGAEDTAEARKAVIDELDEIPTPPKGE